MRTRQPCVVQDTAADPHYENWREPALACGFASAAAVPMIAAEKVLGVISLYSDKKGTFHEAELTLLKELASDLAFAWVAIEHERERRRAELRVSAFAYVAWWAWMRARSIFTRPRRTGSSMSSTRTP
jgi:GAF domain-containing protein